MNILEVKDLTVIHDKNIILDSISFNVREGDLLGILGPNGAGKTTLFRAILALTKHKGHVSILGYKDEARLRVLPFISYLPQRIDINNNFPATVNDLVSTALLQLSYIKRHANLIKGYEHDLNSISVDEALEMVGLKDKKDLRISNLSGGELQRALIARVIITRSPLLILDEPFTALDIDAQTKLFNLLKMLNEELKITIILAAHDLFLLMKLAKDIACINKRLFFHGSKEECLNKDMLRLYSESAMQLHMHDHI